MALRYMLSTSVMCMTLRLQRASRMTNPQVCQLLVIMAWHSWLPVQSVHCVCCLALVSSCISPRDHLQKAGLPHAWWMVLVGQHADCLVHVNHAPSAFK